MSSPVNFPDSDDEMQEREPAEQLMPNAPPRQPLFDPGTPSTTRGTPRKSAVPSTPGIMARRALGMSTPKRTPLFEGTTVVNSRYTVADRRGSGKLVPDEHSKFISKEDPKADRATIRFGLPLLGSYGFPIVRHILDALWLELTPTAEAHQRRRRTDEGTSTQPSV